MCRAAMESKVKKFISHMDTIGRINADARNWLEQIPLGKWALSHDGGQRYGIMITNMSKVFNCVLKGAHNLPITALVQLTFYRVNSYFTVRREHGASRLALGEEFTPHIDAKIKAKVVKTGSHEVLLYDHVAGRFHVKLDTLLEAVIGNLAHIMLPFKQGLAHLTKHFCYDSHVRTFLLLVIVKQLIFDNLYKVITPHVLTYQHGLPCFIPYLMSWSGLNIMDR